MLKKAEKIDWRRRSAHRETVVPSGFGKGREIARRADGLGSRKRSLVIGLR
jgi:hypothetical protein